MAIKRQSITFPDISFDDPKLNALMQFIRAQAAELQKLQQMLRAGAAGQVLEKSTQADYDATWQDFSGGSITGGANEGPGAQVYDSVAGTELRFRTLIEGANIVIVQDAKTITIAATTTGGTGTVTSVAIHSTDLVVSGSPILEDGIIELEIAENAVSYDKMQQTSQDSVVLGRRSGEGAGNIEELNAADLLTIVGAQSGYPKQLAYAGIV